MLFVAPSLRLGYVEHWNVDIRTSKFFTASKPGLVRHESIPVENYHEFVGGHLNFTFGDDIVIGFPQVPQGLCGG